MAQEPTFRLMPRAPESRPTSLPALPPGCFASLREAEAEALLRQVNLLVFLTDRESETGRRVERETFADPAVRRELAGLVLARLDVGDRAHWAAVRRLLDREELPVFVLRTPSGMELHRWNGLASAADFISHLRRDPGLRPATDPFDQKAAQVEFHLRRSELGKALALIDVLEKLDPERTEPALADVLWDYCTAAHKRQDWPALRTAVPRYLALRATAHAEDARCLLGVAQFETTGTVSADLQSALDERLERLASSAPGKSAIDRVSDRIGRLLGEEPQPNPKANAVGVWVDRVNAATEELTDMGRVAVPGLRALLLRGGEGGRRAGVVLSRLRLPETTPWLIERLADRATPLVARAHIVQCIGMHAEERCLPILLAQLAKDHPPAVRTAAVEGIKDTIGWSDRTTRQDLADAMAAALESTDFDLRAEVLQGLFLVDAPIPLDALLDLLADRRPLRWGEHRICDNALWILQKQLGLSLQHADGTAAGDRCTPEAAAWLRAWHAQVQDQLRWDPDTRCYRVLGR